MILNALLLAACPQSAADHSTLHPDSAFLFVEIPDVSTMLGAYQNAPFVQMVRDEEVRKAVYGVLESFDIDLDEQFAKLGSIVGLPKDDASAPAQALVKYLGRLRSASVSLTFRASPAAAPVHALTTTISQMQELTVALDDNRIENGSYPETLEALGDEEAAKRDGWGRPFVYARTETGYSLLSYGADGKPGGEGADADIAHGQETETGKQIARSFASQLGGLAIFSFNDAASAKWAHDTLAMGAGKLHMKAAPAFAVTYGGANGTLERWTGGDDVEFPVFTILTDKELVIGAGAITSDGAIDLAAGRASSISKNAKFVELPKRLPPAQGVRIGNVFVQSEGLMQLAHQGGQQTEALKELIERSGGEIFGRMQLVGDRFISEAITTPSSKDYFGKSMGQKPIPPELWKCIPDDAIAFYATTVDGALLYKELLTALSADGNDLQSRVRELEEKHHVNLERDLFANLQGGAVGYMLAVKGIPPGMAVIADLKDPAAFTRGMGALLKLLADQEGAPFTIKENAYKYKEVECPKWTFSFNQGESTPGFGGVMTPTPTVAVVKNRLLVTLSSTRATKEIKRLLGEEGVEHALAKSPSRPPPTATVIGYMDWAEFIGGVYKTAMGFASLAGAGGAKLDLAKFPEASVFVRFFKPTVLYSQPIDGGTYAHLESSFGPETWGAFLGGVIAGVAVSKFEEVRPPPPDAPSDPTPPTAPTPPTDDATTATRVSISAIQTALAVYRSESGKLPPTLDALGQPTPNYPKGFFNGGALPHDGWNRAFHYVPSADGKTYRIWSVGPDGDDQGGAGDDIELR